MLANMGQVMAIMRVYGNDVTAMMRMMRMQRTAGNDERAHSKRRLNTQGVECGQKKAKLQNRPQTKSQFIGFHF